MKKEIKKEINEKYRFNEGRHLHQLFTEGEWKNLTGCTTILGIVAKPALIQWSANVTAQYILDNYVKGGDDLPEICKEAKVAHRKRKESAGEYGTKTHEEVEKYITQCISEFDGRPIDIETNGNKSIRNFVDWARKNKVKFLATEQNIYSERLFIGGIVDFVCEIDGQVFVGDIKTAKSGIYPENFWQCAGYDIMMKDMKLEWAEKIKGYVILNLKENGQFLEERSVSNGENTKAFLACLDIYRIKERIKKQLKLKEL